MWPLDLFKASPLPLYHTTQYVLQVWGTKIPETHRELQENRRFAPNLEEVNSFKTITAFVLYVTRPTTCWTETMIHECDVG